LKIKQAGLPKKEIHQLCRMRTMKEVRFDKSW